LPFLGIFLSVATNTSDKAVAGVDVDIIDIAPGKCAIMPESDGQDGQYGFSEAELPVHLGPHSRGVAGGIGEVVIGSDARTVPAGLPERMVDVARHAGSAYMQVQVGVVAIYFQDGSTWPASWLGAGHPPSSAHAFDPILAEAEADKCSDTTAAAAVVKALKSVKEITFSQPESSESEPQHNKALPPHLRFSCTLESSRAICRMPLSQDPRNSDRNTK